MKLVHWLEAFNNYSCQYFKVSFPTKLALSFSPLSKLKQKKIQLVSSKAKSPVILTISHSHIQRYYWGCRWQVASYSMFLKFCSQSPNTKQTKFPLDTFVSVNSSAVECFYHQQLLIVDHNFHLKWPQVRFLYLGTYMSRPINIFFFC